MVLRLVVDLAGRPPWVQMAVDEALLEAVAAGVSDPVLRLYTFSPSSVSIGLFQSLSSSVRLEEAERLGVPVVRRPSGGGSVLHTEGGELVYAVALRAEGRLRGAAESFRVICGAVAEAARRLGAADARVEGVNDVVAGGRKVSGSAQARRRGALLQHGTLLLRPDKELMDKVLAAPREKLGSHGASRVSERVAGLDEIAGRRIGLLEAAWVLADSISRALGLPLSRDWYTDWELEEAERLAGKYRSAEWLWRRP